jgi:hypothetical protein
VPFAASACRCGNRAPAGATVYIGDLRWRISIRRRRPSSNSQRRKALSITLIFFYNTWTTQGGACGAVTAGHLSLCCSFDHLSPHTPNDIRVQMSHPPLSRRCTTKARISLWLSPHSTNNFHKYKNAGLLIFFSAVRGEYEWTPRNGANECWIQLCAVACGGAGTKLQHAAHCKFIVSLLLLATLVH